MARWLACLLYCSGELLLCCCHGGPSAAHAPARHVHRLRCAVLRVQVGREPGGDAEGHRLRLRQGRRLRADRPLGGLLQPALRRRALLLRLQQLLPEERRPRGHLRLLRRRHPHRRRPQRRILQVPCRRKRRRHRDGHGNRHRHRDGHRNDPRRWHGRGNGSNPRRGRGSGHRDGRRRRDRHRSRRGDDGSAGLDVHGWHAGEPLRRRVRPVRQQHEPRLQPCRRPPRRRRRSPRGAAALPPLLSAGVRWLACRKGGGRAVPSAFSGLLIVRSGSSTCSVEY